MGTLNYCLLNFLNERIIKIVLSLTKFPLLHIGVYQIDMSSYTWGIKGNCVINQVEWPVLLSLRSQTDS